MTNLSDDQRAVILGSDMDELLLFVNVAIASDADDAIIDALFIEIEGRDLYVNEDHPCCGIVSHGTCSKCGTFFNVQGSPVNV